MCLNHSTKCLFHAISLDFRRGIRTPDLATHRTLTDDPKIFFHFVFSLSRCCFVTLTKVRNPFWPLRQKCLSAKWLLVGALYYSISWGMKRNMKECLNFWPKNIGLESKQYIWAQCWCKDNDSNNNYWFQQLNSAICWIKKHLQMLHLSFT